MYNKKKHERVKRKQCENSTLTKKIGLYNNKQGWEGGLC